MVNVSIFASAVRPMLWPAMFRSLEGTTVDYEVVFAGNSDANMRFPLDSIFDNKLKYITTSNIKPAQCYEIARRYCSGETVIWAADDCEFPNDVIGKAYQHWKSKDNEKLILSIQTKESGILAPAGEFCNMRDHSFYGGEHWSPLMAPICLMSRKFLDDLGGLDSRYICGQYENDIVMRAYSNGATVEIFGDKSCYVDIDHLKKSKDIGESKSNEDFVERPFAKGYMNDRKVLEDSWTIFDPTIAFKKLEAGERPSTLRTVVSKQIDEFKPYPNNIPLDRSYGNNLSDMWD